MQHDGSKNCMTVHERLKEERERLGLTQPQMAAAAEVGKTTVINWEKGASSPSAVQLAALAPLGVDVLYVVMGQRTRVGLDPLSAEESALLDNYKHASPAGKEAARAVLFAITEQKKAAKGGQR